MQLTRFFASMAVCSSVATAQQYELIDLGPGMATALNDVGQVVISNFPHGRLWDNGVTVPLSALPAWSNSTPLGINNAGLAVGFATSGPRAVTWQGGQPTDLGFFGGVNAELHDINNSGAMAGVIQLPSGGTEVRAFRLDSTITVLPTLGGNLAHGLGINRHGTVVGFSRQASGPDRACIWVGNTITPVGLSTTYSYGNAINDQSTVVGHYIGSFPVELRGFVFDGAWQTLPELPGATRTIPEGINELGQIVGSTSRPPNPRVATLWEFGQVIDLNTRIAPNSGWVLERATDVNNRGWIVGLGQSQGQNRAFLLVPTTGVVKYCPASANSSGQVAHLDWSGSTSVSANDFSLTADVNLPGRACVFFYNRVATRVPLAGGFRCVGAGAPAIFRVRAPVITGQDGTATCALDVTLPPASSGAGLIAPGDTWYFQSIYRDPLGTLGANLSNALAVTFTP